MLMATSNFASKGKATVNQHAFALVLGLMMTLLLAGNVFAATVTSVGSGNWSNGSTWDSGSVPTASDDVVIAAGHIVTLDGSYSANSLTINATGTLRFGSASGSYTLTIAGNVTNNGTIDTDDGGFAQHTLVIGGNFDNSSGTFNGDQTGGNNLEVINVTFNGTSAMSILGAPTFYKLTHSGSGALSTGSSTITVKNQIDLQSTAGSFQLGSGGLIFEGSLFKVLGGSFDATTNSALITFTGTTAPTLQVDGNNNPTFTFYDCTVEGASLSLEAVNANVTFQFNGTLTLTDQQINTVTSSTDYTETIAYGSGSTLVYNGSSNQTVGIEWTTTVAPTNVKINNTAGVTISSGDRSISGDLYLTDGELDHSGILTVNGNIIGGSGIYGQTNDGTLVLNGASTSTVTVTNTFTLHNLTVNKTGGSSVIVSVEPAASINTDANATIYIQQGTLRFTRTSQLNLGSSNTLKIDATGVLETGGTDISGFATFTLAAGSTVKFNGTSNNETIPAQTYGNIVVDKSSYEATLGGGITLTSDATYNSTLQVASGALNLGGQTLTMGGTAGSHILQVDDGATLRTGDAAGTTAGTDITGFDTYTFGTTSTVVYNGYGASETIVGTTYGNLVLNNSSGFASLSASNKVAVTTGVTFTAGVITTTAGDQFVLLPGATVSGASATSYVNGPMQKQYDATNLGGTAEAQEIPVGKSGTFRPVNIEFASITSGTVTLTVEQVESDPITTNDPPSGFTDTYDSRYWTIVESGGATHTGATVVLDYNGYSVAAPNNVRIIQGSDTDGANYTTAGTYSGLSGTLVTHTGVTDFTTNTNFTFATIQATKYWDGGAGDGLWSSDANWNDDVAPSPGDIVILEHTNGGVSAAYTVTLNTSESIGDLTIDPEGGNAITLQITANSLTISGTGEALTLESGATLTINGPTAAGITMSNDGDVNFKNGSTYNLSTGTGISTGGTYTFGSTSTTNISSTTDGSLKALTYGDLTISHASGTLSANGDVSCQNFTMDDAGSVSINGGLTVAQNFSKSSTGSLTITGGTLGVTGTITVSGGTVKVTGTGASLSAASTISNSGGDIIIDGASNSTISGAVTNTTGTIQISGTGTTTFSSTVTNTDTISVSSTAGAVSFQDVSNSTNGVMILANANAVTFNGAYSGAGVISATGSGAISFESTFTPGGSCTFGSQALSLKGNVDVQGGVFTPSSATTFTGTTFQISGTGQVSSTAGTITFAGTANQTIAGSPSFYNVTINNTSDVTLNSTATIEGALTLTAGDIVTTSTNLLTFGTGATVSDGSNSSHINGPAAKQTNSTLKFAFPVGNGSRWRRIAIEPSSTTAGTYTVQYVYKDPTSDIGSTLSSTGDTDLDHISTNQYWIVTPASGSPNFNVTLYWEDTSDGVDVDKTKIVVAQWISASSYWESRGGSVSGLENAPGNVRSNEVSSWDADASNYFTFGSTTSDNSLPVTLNLFEANVFPDKVVLNWKTASEVNNMGFNVYRKSQNSDQWEKLNTNIIPGAGNASSEHEYEYIDETIVAGETYSYRLESVSFNGEVEVFNELTKTVEIPLPETFTLHQNYPNPFNPQTTIKFELPEAQTVSVLIYNINGQLVRTLINHENLQAGVHKLVWDATDDFGRPVSSGIYIYRFVSPKFTKFKKMTFLK